MNVMDILVPMVQKVFGRNQQFDVAASGVHSIYIRNKSGDMRSLHIMIHDQRIRGWISGVEAEHIDSLWWDYDLRDPDTLDLLQGRLVEFAQTRARDLRK